MNVVFINVVVVLKSDYVNTTHRGETINIAGRDRREFGLHKLLTYLHLFLLRDDLTLSGARGTQKVLFQTMRRNVCKQTLSSLNFPS
jgi:hypothetical protein